MISIIIPVFNVEVYLSRCLDSLLSQTYKDLEIIPLINILNIKENNVVYFSAKDVDTLIKYKLEEKSFKRKTYF